MPLLYRGVGVGQVLRRIVYLSSAINEFTEAELDALLVGARKRNADDGITGLLMYADGAFLQLIEGPADVVGRLFDSIVADPRHHGIICAEDTETEERGFSDWSMGYVRADAGDQAALPGFRELTQAIRDHDAEGKQLVIFDFMSKSFLSALQPSPRRA